MQKQGQLFYLIKSLDRSEKRYFKLYCSTLNVNSNYLKLFDALEKQEYYDESAIKSAFQNEVFIKQLHVTKIYLSQLILKCLRNYHHKVSKNTEILDLIRNAEILYIKELYHQCYHTLKKAEGMATKYEKTHLHAEILSWQRKLQLTMDGRRTDKIEEISGAMDENIKIQQNLNKYWQLIVASSRFNSPRNEETGIDDKAIEAYAGKPLSTAATVLMHHILYSQGVMGQKSEQAEQQLNALIAHLENHKHLIKDDPGTYINSLNNLVTFFIMQRRYDEALAMIQEVRKTPDLFGVKKNNRLRMRTMLRTYNVELELYRDLKAADEALTLMKTIQSFILKYEKSVPQSYYILFWNQFANIYFMINDHSNALIWLNKIIQTRINDRIDLQRYARLIHLMIHFDLGNVVFLRYSIDSCRRFMKKHGVLSNFEKICLKHFAKLSHLATSDYRKQYKKFYHDLFIKDKNLVTPTILDYVDIKSWLEQKTRQPPIATGN